MRVGRPSLSLLYAVTVIAVSLSAAVAWGVPLSVQSSPINGIRITGSSAGTTNYSRNLSAGTQVSLTAPLTVNSNGTDYDFVRWMLDGDEQPAGQKRVSFTVSADSTAVAAYAVAAPRRDVFVATNGSPTGAGTIDDPIDLLTALTTDTKVLAGDNVWIRGGTYTSASGWNKCMGSVGTSEAPITYRAYAGERPVLKTRRNSDSVLHIMRSPYVRFWGLDVNASTTKGNGIVISRGNTGLKLINNVIHDSREAYPTETSGIVYYSGTGAGHELYGNIVYKFGGQGMRWVNNTTKDLDDMEITDNVIFNVSNDGIQFDPGMKSGLPLGNMLIEGNIMYLCGNLGGCKSIHLRGGMNVGMDNIRLINNVVYEPDVWGRGPLVRIGRFSQNMPNKTVTATGNVLLGGDVESGLSLNAWSRIISDNNLMFNGKGPAFSVTSIPGGWHKTRSRVNNNRYYGTASSILRYAPKGATKSLTTWRSWTGWDSASKLAPRVPTVPIMRLRPNAYEPSKAYLAIYNKGGRSTVSVNLGALWGMRNGESYKITSVENIWGHPVAHGTYSGPIRLTPHGRDAGRVFTAYLVERSLTLKVQSTPVTNVLISGTPLGRTNYSRRPADKSCVTLAAPAFAWAGSAKYEFVRWTLNGVAQANGQKTVSFNFHANTTAIAVYALQAARRDVYVAVNGTPDGAGTIGDPIDLLTALTTDTKVLAGDNVWLRGGTYSSLLGWSKTSGSEGTASAPIVYRAYPGERATISATGPFADTLTIDREYVWFWGLDITSPSSTGLGIAVKGRSGDGTLLNGLKLINNAIHDSNPTAPSDAVGINYVIPGPTGAPYTWGAGHELYGNLVYRIAGQGIKTYNDPYQPESMTLVDNVIFLNNNDGINNDMHGHSRPVGNLLLDGNIVYDNSRQAGAASKNVVIDCDASQAMDNVRMRNCVLYLNDTTGYESCARLGKSPTASTATGTMTLTDNVIIGGGWAGGLEVFGLGRVVSRCNLLYDYNNGFAFNVSSVPTGWNKTLSDVNFNKYYYGTAAALQYAPSGTTSSLDDWRNWTSWDGASMLTNSPPPAPIVRLRQNLYEPTKAYMAVYNGGGGATVNVDLGALWGMTNGQGYRITSVEDIWAAPAAQGIYSGPVSLTPQGIDPGQVFTAYLVEKTLLTLNVQSTPVAGIGIAGSPAATTNYRAQLEPGSSVSLTAPATVVRSGKNYWFVRWYVNGVNQGLNRRAIAFDISADTTAIATYKYVRYLKITGPTKVIGGTTVKYACRAYYSVGGSSLVTYKARWYENSRYARFLSPAKMKTYAVRSKAKCRITAKYAGVSGYCNIYIVRR